MSRCGQQVIQTDSFTQPDYRNRGTSPDDKLQPDPFLIKTSCHHPYSSSA